VGREERVERGGEGEVAYLDRAEHGVGRVCRLVGVGLEQQQSLSEEERGGRSERLVARRR